jgi:tetraacyldisaccharide-1-P 4'-kinase
MISFKGTHFPKDIILYAVFFYVRYGVSYRDHINTREVFKMPIISILNPKGGSGKTTLSTNLARALHERGLSVLIVNIIPFRRTFFFLIQLVVVLI